MDKHEPSNLSKFTNVPKTVSDTIQELNTTNLCESDDNEPRKTVPITSAVSSKAEKHLR